MKKINARRRQNEKKQGDYWSGRFEQLEAALYDTSTEKIKEIERLYRQSLKIIDGQINAWYQRFAVNNKVTPQEAFRLLNSGELEELRWTLQEYIRHGRENGLDGRWIKELENASAKVHIQRLEGLKLEVQAELEKLSGKTAEAVTKHIEDTYTEAYYKSAFEIEKGTGEGVKLMSLNPDKVKQIVSKPWAIDGRNFSETLWTNKTKLINTVNNILSTMVMTGNDTKKATADLARQMDVSTAQAGRLIRTEAAVFSNNAQRDSFKDLGVKEYQIIESLDSRTCDICGTYDGEHYPTNRYETGVTAPPFHPNCRGTITPYSTRFDDILKDVGSRAARGTDGKTHQIEPNITYKEWKEKYVD